MKRLLVILAAAAALAACGKQETTMSEKMVYSQMTRCPRATLLDYTNDRLKWNYTPGLELRAFLDVYEAYGDQKIYDYVFDWYDAIVNEDGTIQSYDLEKYSTDLICPGKSLFYFYDKTGDPGLPEARSGTRRSIPGRSGSTEFTWPSPSMWSTPCAISTVRSSRRLSAT